MDTLIKGFIFVVAFLLVTAPLSAADGKKKKARAKTAKRYAKHRRNDTADNDRKKLGKRMINHKKNGTFDEVPYLKHKKNAGRGYFRHKHDGLNHPRRKIMFKSRSHRHSNRGFSAQESMPIIDV